MASDKPAEGLGVLLVFGSAAVWSFGGAIARFLHLDDSWAIVFWRSTFAAAFLLAMMWWRDGWAGTRALFRAMGLAGLGVGACFATASSSFVLAMQYTTIANILLMQAGVPLIAALVSFLLFRERVDPATWVAIPVVILGVGIMVSGSLTGQVSPIGDALSLLMALAFAGATVITRRHARVAMMPAVCTGTAMAAALAATLLQDFAVSPADAGLLFVFGALNLGLGMALFVRGVRRIPATLAALIGVAEPVLGPVWVWLVHGELPTPRTLIGGGVVLAALLGHLLWQALNQRTVTVMPMPD
ncbi:MAG: DMT family transporter [Rhodoferax sp.]|nr:DMT family transporter [Rhodoferax sp.]